MQLSISNFEAKYMYPIDKLACSSVAIFNKTDKCGRNRWQAFIWSNDGLVDLRMFMLVFIDDFKILFHAAGVSALGLPCFS